MTFARPGRTEQPLEIHRAYHICKPAIPVFAFQARIEIFVSGRKYNRPGIDHPLFRFVVVKYRVGLAHLLAKAACRTNRTIQTPLRFVNRHLLSKPKIDLIERRHPLIQRHNRHLISQNFLFFAFFQFRFGDLNDLLGIFFGYKFLAVNISDYRLRRLLPICHSLNNARRPANNIAACKDSRLAALTFLVDLDRTAPRKFDLAAVAKKIQRGLLTYRNDQFVRS